MVLSTTQSENVAKAAVEHGGQDYLLKAHSPGDSPQDLRLGSRADWKAGGVARLIPPYLKLAGGISECMSNPRRIIKG